MNKKTSAIWSEYIIDGIRMSATPGDILCASCKTCKCGRNPEKYDSIVDETVDPAPYSKVFDNGKIDEYLKKTVSYKAARQISPEYPEFITKSKVSEALLSAIWKDGHFCMNDIELSADWEWDSAPLGNMAAFYKSVESFCGYAGELGVGIKDYSFREGNSRKLEIRTGLNRQGYGQEYSDEEDAGSLMEEKKRLLLGTKRKCPQTLTEDSSAWVIYVPFDTCDFRLGGSLLSELTGDAGGKEPELADTEYFRDCFEVVRELIEDGIVKSGTGVGNGGLMTALSVLSSGRAGLSADISGLSGSYGEQNLVRILFGEIPGVIIEIEDSDYDYVDAEFLLQDVAYYPLGHPSPNAKGLSINMSDLSDISGIMLSLLNGQASEGED